MHKIILGAVLLVILFTGILFLAEPGEEKRIPEMGGAALYKEDLPKEEGESDPQEDVSDDFILCLKEAGVIIYGTQWCPACRQLVDSFGGYDAIDPIYVECTEENERCDEEMKDVYVPEIQVRGELYDGSRSPDALAAATGCEL